MFVSVNTKLTNSVRVPSPETCDTSSSSNTSVRDKFIFLLPSAWEPISAILHKIRTQCACLLLQQLYTPYINALVSGHPHMLLSTYQSACQLCNTTTCSTHPQYPSHRLLAACQQRGAVTLSQVQANLIIVHHIPRKITTSRPCPHHLACHTLFTHTHTHIYIYISGFVTAVAVYRILLATLSCFPRLRAVGASIPFLHVCSLSRFS